MPTPQISDDALAQRVRVWRDHGRNISASARALGIRRSTFQGSLDTARARGLLTDEDAAARQGFCITAQSTRFDRHGAVVARSITEKPEGAEYTPPADHAIKGVSVGPLRCERFAAPCAKDAFAYNGGFRSEREIVAIHFDEQAGEIGRKTMVLHER